MQAYRQGTDPQLNLWRVLPVDELTQGTKAIPLPQCSHAGTLTAFSCWAEGLAAPLSGAQPVTASPALGTRWQKAFQSVILPTHTPLSMCCMHSAHTQYLVSEQQRVRREWIRGNINWKPRHLESSGWLLFVMGSYCSIYQWSWQEWGRKSRRVIEEMDRKSTLCSKSPLKPMTDTWKGSFPCYLLHFL